MMNAPKFREAILSEIKTFSWNKVATICHQLTEHLNASDAAFDLREAENILQLLRNNRLFQLMQKVGDVLIQTGRQSHKIKRLYAQALIDQNILFAASCVLRELLVETANALAVDSGADEENIEASGLMGRLYKQLYINSNNSTNPVSVNFLRTSITFYLDTYTNEPLTRTWHGINAVALLNRASKDGIILNEFPEPNELAKQVLQTIQDKYDAQQADAWDFATAAEACIALQKPREALVWLSGYAKMPYCNAFNLASTLRQLEEVWQLDLHSESGSLLLPLLRAELLDREGGNITLSTEELKLQLQVDNSISQTYAQLITDRGNNGSKPVLEKIFGEDSFRTYKWYMTGANRCLSVARIGRETSKGEGTGFLLKGHTLHEKLGEEFILITNAHVVSDNPDEKALHPDEAVIIFETLDKDYEFRVSEIIWSSPSNDLDATLLRFSPSEQERLGKLVKGVPLYSLSKHLPVVEEPPAQRIYIIGHPYGGTLQLSLQDNLLLDHENPKLHYRTPTEGGSSGSPVFNQQWELIGLHHAGSRQMPCLNKKPGYYEANEGIWMQAIREKLQIELTF